jgi:hypothetical protein
MSYDAVHWVYCGKGKKGAKLLLQTRRIYNRMMGWGSAEIVPLLGFVLVIAADHDTSRSVLAQ